MNTKTKYSITIAAISVAALLAGLIVLLLTAPSDSDNPLGETDEGNDIITLLERIQGDITEINIKNSYGEYLLKVDETGERSVSGISDVLTGVSLDDTTVLRVLTEASVLRADEVVEDNVTEESLIKYGLDSPEGEYSVTFSDGEVFSAAIGNSLSNTTRRYMYVNGDKSKVYSVSAYLTQELLRPKEELISTDIFSDISDSQKSLEGFALKEKDKLKCSFFVNKNESLGNADSAIRYNALVFSENGGNETSEYLLSSDINTIVQKFFLLKPVKVERIGKIQEAPDYTIQGEFQGTSEEDGYVIETVKIYGISETEVWDSLSSSEKIIQVRLVEFSSKPGVVFAIEADDEILQSFIALNLESYFDKGIFNYSVYEIDGYKITYENGDTYDIRVMFNDDKTISGYTVNETPVSDIQSAVDLYSYIIRMRVWELNLDFKPESGAVPEMKIEFDFKDEYRGKREFTLYTIDDRNCAVAWNGKFLYTLSRDMFEGIPELISAVK